MEYQDFTDAASIALNHYLDQMKEIVNQKLQPGPIGKIEVGMGGEWALPLTKGRIVYATPFYEMGEGLPIAIDSDDETTLYNETLSFEITGNLEKDAENYIALIKDAVLSIV